MKILIYGNRKQDDMMWDISTPEQRAAAFLILFQYLRDEWNVYNYDYWGSTLKEQAYQKELYEKANKGDSKAAEILLKQRVKYEYEEWTTASVLNPLEELRKT